MLYVEGVQLTCCLESAQRAVSSASQGCKDCSPVWGEPTDTCTAYHSWFRAVRVRMTQLGFCSAPA